MLIALLTRYLGQVLLIGLICFVALNALYAFSGFLKPLGSFGFRSEALAGVNDDGWNLGNKFADHWLGKLPCPLPADYMLGIDRQKMEFEQNKRAYSGRAVAGWRLVVLLSVRGSSQDARRVSGADRGCAGELSLLAQLAVDPAR